MNKMSDDLISRKEALERLRLLRKFNPQEVMKVAVDAAEQQINFCGTAFDKDKVIEQIKVLSTGIILNTNMMKSALVISLLEHLSMKKTEDYGRNTLKKR